MEIPPEQRARAALHHLLKRWGVKSEEINPKNPPVLIFLKSMTGPDEVWKNVSPKGEGKDTVYERIE